MEFTTETGQHLAGEARHVVGRHSRQEKAATRLKGDA